MGVGVCGSNSCPWLVPFQSALCFKAGAFYVCLMVKGVTFLAGDLFLFSKAHAVYKVTCSLLFTSIDLLFWVRNSLEVKNFIFSTAFRNLIPCFVRSRHATVLPTTNPRKQALLDSSVLCQVLRRSPPAGCCYRISARGEGILIKEKHPFSSSIF